MGLYVDSDMMRGDMFVEGKKAGCPSPLLDVRRLQCDVVCLATETSALLLCRSFFPSRDGKHVLPKSLRDVLESEQYEMASMWPKAAKMALFVTFGLSASNLCNVAQDLLNPDGCMDGPSQIIRNTSTVVRIRLQQSFQPFSENALTVIPNIDTMRKHALIEPAVYTAVVGLHVKKRCDETANDRRQGSQGITGGFQDASGRVLASPKRVAKRQRFTGP